ncbi:MAG: hypothetical protein GY862_00880 [Gammaproteobacteria bacterium]|nr:hypothetical protein [Gammaproteobacteria bacterium]
MASDREYKKQIKEYGWNGLRKLLKAYIVTEKKIDSQILKKLLPPEHTQHIVFVPAGGRSSAKSLARSILANRKCPVALVMDADTTNSQVTEERYQIVSDLLRSAASDVPSEVFLIVPEIEILLFEDRDFLQKLVGNKISDEVWSIAKFTPEKTLKSLLKTKNIASFIDEIEDISVLQRSQVLREIDSFLTSSATAGFSRSHASAPLPLS